MTPLQLVDRMSTSPARIFGLTGGSLEEGQFADVVILDPDAVWTYEPAEGFSKSRNSPWSGRTLTGRVEATYVNGRLVYRAGRGVVIQ
jgi:dihydroorotase